MSVHAPHGHGPAHSDVRSEEDRISTASILGVGVASLLLFLVSGLAVSAYFQARKGERTALPIPAEIGQSKIAMVEQQLFEVAFRGERDRATRLERLGSYGWVDRSAGVAHIPIDRAMELVAKGVRARPGAGEQERRVPGAQP